MTEDSSSRTLAAALRRDLKCKLVVLTGARQAGKIHKMRDWKAFLKGAWDGRAKGQASHSTAAGHDRLELPYADPRKLMMASPAVRSPEPAR